MKKTAESLLKIRKCAVEIRELAQADMPMESKTRQQILYYTNALLSQLDAVTGYILEER
jgi:competence transcription factor ComK